MQIVETLSLATQPLVLTIGNFEGVHLGHQHLLQQVVAQAEELKTRSAAITFKNHPMEFFYPQKPIERLCSLNQKIEWIDRCGIDVLFLIPFTEQFASQTAEQFLQSLHRSTPFSHLILGHDARFGKGREGDPARVKGIAQDLGFIVEYVTPFLLNGKIVSSRAIRQEIQEGNLDIAKQMLGRPYTIQSLVIKGSGNGSRIGFPTANVQVINVCLPPLGVWLVTVGEHAGIANLGFAPTLRNDPEPLLEVHLLDSNPMLYGEQIEIAFHKFLRPEKKFQSIDELKEQIAKDVSVAKDYF